MSVHLVSSPWESTALRLVLATVSFILEEQTRLQDAKYASQATLSYTAAAINVLAVNSALYSFSANHSVSQMLHPLTMPVWYQLPYLAHI